MEEISSGAEATIYLDNDLVVKKRISKAYRIPDIDNSLRKSRTKREAKVLEKLQGVIPVPKVHSSTINVSSKTDYEIAMDYIEGKKLRDLLSKKNYISLCKTLGSHIAKLHNNGIIHGDLTTSNMMLSDIDGKLYLIDFGLSFFSDKVEDMAVELHLLRQGLESKHPEIWDVSYGQVLSVYQSECDFGAQVIKRLDRVESRGRYQNKSKKTD